MRPSSSRRSRGASSVRWRAKWSRSPSTRALSPGADMGRIVIAGLRELGIHGVLPEEQTRPQPFEVDVELTVDLDAASTVYETSPVGGPPQPDYLNAVVAVDTTLPPRDLLRAAKRLESAAGRVRGERWGPRTLDVDVLLVGDVRMDEGDLVVPHPRMTERAFVLVPLSDLDPAWAPLVPRGQTGVRPTAIGLELPE